MMLITAAGVEYVRIASCEDNNVTFHNSGSDYTGLGSLVSQNKAAHQSVVWSAGNKQYPLMNLNYTAE